MIILIQNLSLFILLVSYLSSLRAFRLDMPVIFKHFSFFLLVALVGELFGTAWPKWIHQYTPFSNNNQWFYVFFHFAIYLFYLYFFYKVVRLPHVRPVIKLLAIVYMLFASVNALFIQGFFKLNTYSDVLGNFILIFLSISYFYQLLRSPEIISLKNDMVFWISTGVFIFHLGSLMGNFLINAMYSNSIPKAQNIHMIIMVSAIVMYLTYIIAYLCRKKN